MREVKNPAKFILRIGMLEPRRREVAVTLNKMAINPLDFLKIQNRINNIKKEKWETVSEM